MKCDDYPAFSSAVADHQRHVVVCEQCGKARKGSSSCGVGKVLLAKTEFAYCLWERENRT